jgi:hypothetical protein
MNNKKTIMLIDDLQNLNSKRLLIIAFIISVTFATTMKILWPCQYIFDDAGIVVKYMDSFSEGAFYCYNPSDGPVYGISGFIHGIISGFFAYFHICSPENSVIISNYLGVLITSFSILLILNRVSKSGTLILLGWAITISASSYFIITAFQGLETPLHLALVLLLYWSYLSNQTRTFYLLIALTIISKLDSIPIVIILLVARTYSVFKTHSKSLILAELRYALIWSGIPLFTWLGFTFLVFGSPLPQTAYAKLFFHPHPKSYFSFIVPNWQRDERRLLFYLFCCLFFFISWSAFTRNKKNKSILQLLTLLLGSLGVALLYSIYNPNERMSWYYVLPETLFVLGAISSFIIIIESIHSHLYRILGVGLLILSLILTVRWTYWRAQESIEYINTVEPERIEIGKFIHANASPSDRLFSGHGHIARYSQLYTYDYSGLNSPIITSLIKDGKWPLSELHPQWVVQHGLLDTNIQSSLGYELIASYYNVSLKGYPAWRIYRIKQIPREPILVAQSFPVADILLDDHTLFDTSHTAKYSASQILLHIHNSQHIPQYLAFGVVKRNIPVFLNITLEWDHQQQNVAIDRIDVPQIDLENLVGGRTKACQIKLPINKEWKDLNIHIKAYSAVADTVSSFSLLEPAWLYYDR